MNLDGPKNVGGEVAKEQRDRLQASFEKLNETDCLNGTHITVYGKKV